MEYIQLKKLANNIRINIVECIKSIGVGHIGGSLSIADVLAVLYGGVMQIDPQYERGFSKSAQRGQRQTCLQ